MCVCLHVSTWCLHMSTWKGAATQATPKRRKTTIRGTCCWRHSRCQDPAQRYSRTFTIGSYAAWPCHATSRWTILICPWSSKQGSDCDTPKNSVRAACYEYVKLNSEAAVPWIRRPRAFVMKTSEDGLGPSAPRNRPQFCWAFLEI